MAKAARKSRPQPSRRSSASPAKATRGAKKPHGGAPAGSRGTFREASSLLLVATGVVLCWALCVDFSAEASALGSSGSLGRFVAGKASSTLGVPAFLLVGVAFAWAKRVWEVESESIVAFIRSEATWLALCWGLILGCSGFAALVFGHALNGQVLSGGGAGGKAGALIASKLSALVGTAGGAIGCFMFILFCLSMLTGISSRLFFQSMRTIGVVTAKILGELIAVSVRVLGFCAAQFVAALAWLTRGFRRVGSLAVTHAEESVAESRERLKRGAIAEMQETAPLAESGIEEDSDGAEDDDEDDEEEDEYEEDEDEDEDEYEDDDLDDEDLDDEEDEELDTAAVPLVTQTLKILRREREDAKAVESKKTAVEKIAAPKPSKKSDKVYENPRLDFLVSTEGSELKGPKDDLLIENSARLEEALGNFRIGGKVVEVHPGPVITLYQFQPAPGVKVQRIVNLADDLALALRVASVRVFAPVPGKGTVGIEVPNQSREMVRLRDVLETPEYQTSGESLPLALGKDTYGDPYIANLPRMPHLLIAGATGTGKSVCINSILLSLLYRNSPQELRLILIDPKMLELSVYEDIPHLKAPVVTQAKRARGVLWWAVEEMERRYRLLKQLGVRDVASYNRMVNEMQPERGMFGIKKKKKESVIELQEKDVIATGSAGEGLDRTAESLEDFDDADTVMSFGADPIVPPRETLPRIVIVVDELADLMLTVGREIEELLARLAQKARAAGIHLILATQRPSVNVITGLIKANFPARISFKVASKIDARTVMDTSGAEKLLGQGDMLFVSPAVGAVKRLHSPYVSDQEVHDVVEWIRKQGAPDYDPAIEEMISKVVEAEGKESGGELGDEEHDSFYDQAVTLVIDKGQASTSMVQRAFRIGYNRAARILETMEREGIVGPADGSKPRQVLVGSSQNDY